MKALNKNLRERFIIKLRKFLKIPGREKLLFFEALTLHLWVGLLLKVIPFKRIARIFSSHQQADGTQQPESLQEIKDAVRRAGRVSPWRNRCLVSSLAGRCMLRRRMIDSQLSLGITKNTDGRPVAHAWLKSGTCELVEKSGDYTTLYTF